MDSMPKVLGAGLFDTRDRQRFRDMDTATPTHLRTVQEYELELFCEDGGTSFINGRQHAIKRGCILLASPGDRRQSLLHFRALFVHFSLPRGRLSQMVSEMPRFTEACDEEIYLPYFRKICETEEETDTYADLEKAGILTALLCRLRHDLMNGLYRGDSGIPPTVIPEAIEYIRAHYGEAIRVPDLSARFHISTTHFYRLFHQVTDMTPSDFILQTRLSAAQALLTEGELSLSEIASLCGFNTQTYFTYCFKNRFGLSPKKFRSLHTYPL